MKVFIQTGGDRQVGIFQGQVEVDFKDMTSTDLFDDMGHERNDLRKQLADFFESIWGDGTGIGVQFEDECGDCGSVTAEGKCSNANCITNLPEEDEIADPNPETDEANYGSCPRCGTAFTLDTSAGACENPDCPNG